MVIIDSLLLNVTCSENSDNIKGDHFLKEKSRV